MSGDYRSKKEIAHILIPAVGRKAMDLGGNIEKGEPRFTPSYRRYLNAPFTAPTFKLIGNSLILGSLELLAEVFTLSEKAGIGASQVQQFIKDTMPAPPLISYGEKMVQDNFDGSKGFAIDGGLKDSAHIRKLATELDSPMPALVGLMTRSTDMYSDFCYRTLRTSICSPRGRCMPIKCVADTHTMVSSTGVLLSLARALLLAWTDSTAARSVHPFALYVIWSFTHEYVSQHQKVVPED